MLQAHELEPPLTKQDELLRDHFVREYLFDRDAYKACTRIGFNAVYANTWAEKLLKDGYVQRQIAFLTRLPAADPDQEALDRALVENTLRLVMQRGSDSARVAAARELNAMRGWSKPPEGGTNDDLARVFAEFAQKLPA